MNFVKARPQVTPNKHRGFMEVWIRKSMTSRKGKDLLNFMEMLDDELPWEWFFRNCGDDLFSIMFKLSTYNENYILANTGIFHDNPTETFAGIKPVPRATNIAANSSDAARMNFTCNNLILK